MKTKTWLVVLSIIVGQALFGFVLAEAQDGSSRGSAAEGAHPAAPMVKRIGSVYTHENRLYSTGQKTFTTGLRQWVFVPGTDLDFYVPPDQAPGGAILTGRFTAESKCEGQSVCSVRIALVGDQRYYMHPNPTDLTFDSPDGPRGTDSWSSHSIEQVSPFFGTPGYWSMYVEVRVAGAGTNFSLDNWMFVGEAAWPELSSPPPSGAPS